MTQTNSSGMKAGLWLASVLLALVCAGSCYAQAQEWEFGGAMGHADYSHGSIISPAGTAAAGIRSRFVASAVLTQNMYKYVSGEARYVYHDGDPFLESQSGDIKTSIQGQSHTFSYELLVHVRSARSKIRPYVAAGGGFKMYVVSGPSTPNAPLRTIATLQSTDETKFLTSIGAGVKYYFKRQFVVRFDFRDYITTFPKTQIRPASASATARGLFQMFTPMVGISYAFGKIE